MVLSCPDPTLTETQHIQLFINGLGNHMCTEVCLQSTATLDNTIVYVYANQQHAMILAVTPTSQARSVGWSFSRTPSPGATSMTSISVAASSTFITSKALATTMLSPIEITDHHTKGLCFHCDDKFSQGIQKECKQLFDNEVLYDEYEFTLEENITHPTISLHTLTDIQSCSGRIVQVTIEVNDAQFIVLLDSGTTHNFIDTEVA
jgi:hypothetical protein